MATGIIVVSNFHKKYLGEWPLHREEIPFFLTYFSDAGSSGMTDFIYSSISV